MLRRRDLLLGLPLVVAAGGALALTPRDRMNLLGDRDLEKLVPLSFEGWEVTPSNAMILPEAAEGSLADQLYSQTVSRLYVAPDKIPVMLVIAYGNTQSDLLQLHRPEACYVAVGFQISGSERVEIPLRGDARLPARQLIATSNDRTEPILYWTRIGDYLPTSGNEQRVMKLRSEMRGVIADGVLVRMSTVGDPTPEAFASLRAFAGAMLAAMEDDALSTLIGRPLASEMAG
ncbi:exosortase-associated protein EpsI, V-type [Sandaracinobacteroides sp. A072]|uniref:exosortase-associated protein EpsI, V-type n=1 Tax=Sandaracinobacteroides sp. A072 TaxID=3461146 RepID=UPI0040417964